MTIKSRISYYIGSIFTILFSIICIVIITIFSEYREEEFEARLSEKAITAVKLLIEVQEVDNILLKIIDQNTINKLYNEKTLIFNGDHKLIYSSLDDTKISWTEEDLEYLKINQSFFKNDGENEIFGVFYDNKVDDYFVLISANDNYGKRKLSFLIYLMIGAGCIFIPLIWFLTFSIIKKQLKPLDRFQKQIKNINDLNIETPLETKRYSNNEIDLISNEFNFMMSRIRDAYQKQKEFTSHASHELRTPLARISAQLENQILQSPTNSKNIYSSILQDINQLIALVNSLLILSKIDHRNIKNIVTTQVQI